MQALIGANSSPKLSPRPSSQAPTPHQALLSAGASLDPHDADGTALDNAVKQRRAPVEELLEAALPLPLRTPTPKDPYSYPYP